MAYEELFTDLLKGSRPVLGGNLGAASVCAASVKCEHLHSSQYRA